MRFSSLLRLTAVVPVLAILLAGASVRAQTPIISGTAGTGSNVYYFDLDFRDFSGQQYYAFTYYSSATSLSYEDVLKGLSTVPTFSSMIADTSFGPSLNGLAYAGKTKYNDFAGNNSGEPNGYWSQWNSTNGSSWSYDDQGIGLQVLNPGMWAGASWTADYNTVTDTAPRVAVAAASAPEPGSVALAAFGGAGFAVAARRGRRRRGSAVVK